MRKSILLLAIACSVCLAGACASCKRSEKDNLPVLPGGQLLFKSGFEPDVYIYGNSDDIRGKDIMDWQTDLEGYPQVDHFSLNMIGESPTYAFADLVSDPEDAGNRVLYFQLNDNDPATPHTTRTQNEWNFESTGETFDQGYIRYRVYWHPDLNLLSQYSGSISWFTIMEWWELHNDSKDGDGAGQCRWTLSFNKDSGSGQPLYWALTAEYMQPASAMFDDIWPKQTNSSVPVPIGQWCTFEVFFKWGDASSGRIWVAIKPDGGSRKVIFDVRNYTRHPVDLLPLRGWQCFKLYTSDTILDWVRSQSDARVRAYYDDFEWYSDFP
jgi:hypothetical protein